MSRPGSKSGRRKAGTTKSGITARRRNKGQRTARLIDFARRFGKISALVILVLWLGAWLWLSGSVHRGLNWTQEQIYELSAHAGFAVQDVFVEGRLYTDADVLRALINIERGDPIFMFKPDEAKTLLERISWVRSAHVERRLPGTIYVHLTERQPVALWQHQNKVRVIDEDGVVLAHRKKSADFSRFKDLPIVVGAQAPDYTADLLALLAAEPEVQKRLEAAVRVSDRRWNLKLKNGLTVKLPARDAGLALRRLAAAQEEDGLLDKDLTMIDLREAGRIVVRTAPGAVQDYRAGAKGNAI